MSHRPAPPRCPPPAPFASRAARRAASRAALPALLLAALALPAACGDDGPPAPSDCGRLAVRAAAPDGTAVQAFLALADPGSGDPVRVDCTPGGEPPAGACTPGQAVLPVPPVASLGLVVRAPGHRTARAAVTPAWGAPRDDDGAAGCPAGVREAAVDVVLEPLPPAEATADYRTAFDAATGLQEFLALAVPWTDDLGAAHGVKFYVEDPAGRPSAWFQDTKRWRLHYDFVSRVLRRPVSLAEYERTTYHGADRARMAGTLVWRPDLTVTLDGRTVTGVMTMEFFPYDDLLPSQAAAAFLALQERLPFLPFSGPGRRLAYLPPGSLHEAQAEAAARDLAAAGVPWAPRSTLYEGVTEQRLNPAVSFGILRRMTPEALAGTPVSYTDILVLTRLPNDLPVVGGTITEELQTPLAHVNVAAVARGTPNLALLGASEDPRVKPFLGRAVRFEVTRSEFTLREATAAEVEEFWATRLDRPPLVPPFDLSMEGLPAFADLGFGDAASVGVKAANLAEMRGLIPQHVPDGFALPFRHYDAFVKAAAVTPALCAGAAADCREEGRGDGCDPVDAFCRAGPGGESLDGLLLRLRQDPAAAADSAYRFALLDMVRWLFCHVPQDAVLGAAVDEAVRTRLQGVPARLRSSSNAEDLPDFSGAGLYDSYTGTLGTDKAPSDRLCKVWGSLWNFKAYEERSFWKVDHGAVRMAIAVHPAFPDEQANGVLITQNIADPYTIGMYVNVQKGEVSVTNPADGSTPEVFSIVPSPQGVQVTRQRFSSLSPGVPLLSDAEVAALHQAAAAVQRHFAPLYGEPEYTMALDIEFKFHGPGRDLILKQVRPYRSQ